MDRQDVYKLIDGERTYQEGYRKSGDDDKSVAQWIMIIENHLDFAKDDVYHSNFKNAMNNIRKIAATCVAAMENNDTPSREEEEND